MKTPIKHLFPIVLAAIGLFFAAMVFFIGFFDTEHGIYTDIGTGLTEATETELINDIDGDLVVTDVEIPTIKYVGGTKTVGENAILQELFQFTYQDGLVISGTEEDYVTIYLKDVQDMSGNSVCEKISTADVAAMEEVTSAFIFDNEQDVLYFHKSGVFKIIIKVYYNSLTDVLYEFNIPVEVG